MTDQCKTKSTSSSTVMEEKENNNQENLIHLKVKFQINRKWIYSISFLFSFSGWKMVMHLLWTRWVVPNSNLIYNVYLILLKLCLNMKKRNIKKSMPNTSMSFLFISYFSIQFSLSRTIEIWYGNVISMKKHYQCWKK